MLLDDLGGIYPGSLAALEINHIQRIEVFLLQLEDNRILVGRRYRFEIYAGNIGGIGAFLGEAAAHARHPVKVEHDILGNQFAPVHRCLVVPVNALTDFEDKGQGVGLLEALRQVWFHSRQRSIMRCKTPFVSGYCPVYHAQLL